MERTNEIPALSRFARPAAAALCLAALLGAIPAYAADAVMEEPPAAPMDVPPVASWAGAYAGIQLGYGFAGRTETDGANGVPGETVNTDGFIGGSFAGAQNQSGSIVYGAEGDVNYSGLRGDDGGVESRSGVDGSLRARLGYSVTPDVLVYGTGGVAAQKLRVEQGGEEDSKGMVGYTVGAGTDIKLTNNVFGRVEYRYTDFGSKEFDLGSGSQDVDSKNHRIMVGVGFGF